MNILTMLKFKPTQLLIHIPIKMDILSVQRRY